MLIQELKKSFVQHNLLLTASLIAKMESFPQIFNIVKLSESVDYVHLIPKYDYVETWPRSNRVENVLKERAISSIEYTLSRLINSGVASTKIILGLEFMGHYFNSILDLSLKHATFRRTMGYNDVCNLLSNDPDAKWDKFFDDTTNMNIAKHESKAFFMIRRVRVLVFENSRSIANKVKIILNRHLGGALAFPINMDDHSGKCGIETDTFDDFSTLGTFDGRNTRNATQPLLKTINYVLRIAPFEENIQARQPSSDDGLMYSAIDRLWDVETKNDIISRMPENYKPSLVPIIQSANDAMILGYDKLSEKAALYKKDRTLLTMVYSLLFQVPKLFIGVLDKLILT